MTEFCSFNDTFDDISFSVSGKIKTENCAASEKVVNNSVPDEKIVKTTCESQSVTFDDSIFLSESFTFSTQNSLAESTQKGENGALNEINDNLSIGNNEIPELSQSEHYKVTQCVTRVEDGNTSTKDDVSKSQSKSEKKYKLSDWNLPKLIENKYASRNITEMFEWQYECLANEKVLEKNKNLVYSAPTSAGKTLVSEILAIKTLIERNKKVIFILPFISVVREKMFYFQDILNSSGIRVEGFMGSYNPPGGFQTVQMAICTIEKANSLVNRLLEESKLSEIGAVIVDEMHLIGDPSRGYLLELLLTKLNFMSLKHEEINIQIIGMSATLPNLNLLADWLKAVLYTTDFRPIPLYEQFHVNGEIYDNQMNLIRKLSVLNELETDTDNILQLCLETIANSCSVLIFCPTKNWCENLAQQIAVAIFKLGTNANTTYSKCLRDQLNTEHISEVLEQLKRCPVGLDKILNKTISFGVAFHHAGLTMDERDIVEGAFRLGAIRILIATSTLSSGVNLPARRVIIRTPIFHGKPIDTLTYRQMIGRAGRMGKDTAGESLLICQKNDYRIAKELMSARLEPIESCLNGSGKLKRAILEVIASVVVSTPEDVMLFTTCTLYANEEGNSLQNPVEEALDFLTKNQFVRLQTLEDASHKYVATSLGKACLSSSISPEEGLSLFTELEKARQCFVLETELHLVYLVTPYSACNQWGNIDWMFYLELWEKLSSSMRKVGDLVGVRDSFLVNASRGKIQTNTNRNYHNLQVHKRFFVALALQDLVNEVPLNKVAAKFNCTRGTLQSLQQSAATFAGMVTSFSKQLGWSNVEILISQFQDRLHFGVNRDLLDLMRLPILNGPRARALHSAGIETLVQLASARVDSIENALHKMAPFESEKEREGETKYEAEQRNKVRTIWVTGKQGLTEKEAAEMLILDARRYLELEMGVIGAKWDEDDDSLSNESESETSSSKLDEIQDDGNKTEVKLGNGHSQTDESDSIQQNNSYNSDIFNESTKMLPLDHSNPNLNDTNPSGDKKQLNIEHNNSKQSHSFKMNWSNDSLFENSFESPLNSHISVKIQMKSPESKNSIEIPTLDGDTILENAFASNFSLLQTSIQNCTTPDQKNKSMENSTPNTSSECIVSSQGVGELFDTPLKKITASRLSTSSRKRGRLNDKDVTVSNSGNSCLEQTPLKRKRVTNSKNSSMKKKLSLNSEGSKNIDTTFIISQKSDPAEVNYESNQKMSSIDLTKIEMIDVCLNLDLFRCFCKELEQQKQISLSIGCVKNEIITPKIGINTANPINQNNSNKNLEFSHGNKKISGISISWGGNTAFYIDFKSKTVDSKLKISLLKNTLNNRDLKVKIFDSKEQIKLFKICFQFDLNITLEDPKIADWLLHPEGREKNLQAMAVQYTPEAIKLTQLAGGCKGVGSAALDVNTSLTPRLRSGVEAVSTWHIVNSILDAIAEQDMRLLHTYYIEMESILVLVKMELHGICVNQQELQKLSESLNSYCSILENKAYRLAGRNFSFTSPTDVAKILGINKGKRVSTSKQVLEKNDHPIASLVVQWRKINCTLTKMIYPFLEMVRDNRIHGTCITFNATGRISMHEPNLQTIPRDFEFLDPNSRETTLINCRDVFRTSKNSLLVSADYCQLELRLLTHLSKDPALCAIMRTKEDVFKSIAAKLNNLEEDQVTDQLRQRAKQICYGIIYGMGIKALSEQLNSSEEEATIFLDEFHKKYTSINTYIKQVISECKEEGYVVTIAGRRRYLPNINHHHSASRSHAERQAVNTTIQGSAADIAKNAMVLVENHIQDKFKVSKHKPKLILQLHDEFLYETPEKYADSLAKILKKCMENSVQLDVPFPVKIKQGKSWGSLKEVIL